MSGEVMSGDTDEPVPEPVTSKPFIAVDRITQELIVQQLQAAIGELDFIAKVIQDDPGSANLGLLYVRTVDARTHVQEALKQLPWAPIPIEDGRRTGQAEQPPAP